LRKSKEEARKTEEKKRINSALTNQHLEIYSQEIGKKQPNFVLFFPPLKTTLMRWLLAQLVRGGREGATTGILRGTLGKPLARQKKLLSLSK
jgi:hypothetical protein